MFVSGRRLSQFDVVYFIIFHNTNWFIFLLYWIISTELLMCSQLRPMCRTALSAWSSFQVTIDELYLNLFYLSFRNKMLKIRLSRVDCCFRQTLKPIWCCVYYIPQHHLVFLFVLGHFNRIIEFHTVLTTHFRTDLHKVLLSAIIW